MSRRHASVSRDGWLGGIDLYFINLVLWSYLLFVVLKGWVVSVQAHESPLVFLKTVAWFMERGMFTFS